MALLNPTLVTIRESLEAFLIVSIFAGLVVKLGHREARRYLLWGAGAALALTIVLGVISDAALRDVFDGETGKIFEGVASLFAVIILTYMVFWMYRHTLDLVAGLREKTHAALAANRPGLLFSIAFVAVIREGLETIVFFASQIGESTALELTFAALIGVTVSAILAFLTFTGIVQLNIRKFFAVTGMLLIVFAAGLFMTSIHEFAESGILPETRHVWNTEWLLDQHGEKGALAFLGPFVKAIFGYRESPQLLEALGYFGYLLGVGGWYLAGLLRKPKPTPAVAAAMVATPTTH